MEKVKNLELNYNGIKRNIKNEIRKSFVMCRLNTVIFKVGQFIQNTRCNDEQEINKMYYDFNRANLINKSFLLFIKESLLTQKNPRSLVMIADMLDIYQESNNQIMSSYNENFLRLTENSGYSSIETSNELMKILGKNKYLPKYYK